MRYISAYTAEGFGKWQHIAKGTGEFEACVADDVPVDPEEGSRCGVCRIRAGASKCNT